MVLNVNSIRNQILTEQGGKGKIAQGYYPIVKQYMLSWQKLGWIERAFRWIFSRISFLNLDSTQKKCNTIAENILATLKPVLIPEKPLLAEGQPVLIPEKPLLAEGQPVLIPEKPVFSSKLYGTISSGEQEEISLLSPSELNALIALYPNIDTHRVAQESMTARNSILNIYQKGIPNRLGQGTEANNTLMYQMRFIISKIHRLSAVERKKELLQRLVFSLEDCVPVTQGRLNSLFLELQGLSGFEPAFSAFLHNLKDRVVDEVIEAIHPEMRSSTYAQEHHMQPSFQHPHTKNAYLKRCGKAVGFSSSIAEKDPNANRKLSGENIKKFQDIFKEKLEQQLLPALITAINTQDMRLPNELFFTWAGQNGLAEEVVYAEDVEYPTDATPTESAKNLTSACITEATGLKVLHILGFVV